MEDKRLNILKRNKTFSSPFRGDEETPVIDEILQFWRGINNKEVSEGWRDDRSIREFLYRVKKETKRESRVSACEEVGRMEVERSVG